MGFALLLLYLTAAYIRPGEMFPPLAAYRIHMVLGFVGLSGSALSQFLNRPAVGRLPQLYLITTLLGVVSLSLLSKGWLGGALYAFQEFGITAGIVFLVVLNTTSWWRLKTLVGLVVALSCLLALQSAVAYHYGYRADLFVLTQHIDGPLLMNGGGENGDTQIVLRRVRSLGVLNDPNDFAQGLLMVMPLISLAWLPRHPVRNLCVVVLPYSILLYAIYLSRSRGGLVALLVLTLLWLRRTVGTGVAILGTSLLAVLLNVANATGGRSFSAADESAQGRLEAWVAGLQMLKSHPLFGVGYHNFVDYYDRAAHNTFINCFAELGLVGYFCWLALVTITILELRAVRFTATRSGEAPAVAAWAGAVEIAIYTFLTAAVFLSRTYSFMLYLLIAIGVAVVNLARRSGLETVEIRPSAWLCRVGAIEAASVIAVYIVVSVL